MKGMRTRQSAENQKLNVSLKAVDSAAFRLLKHHDRVGAQDCILRRLAARASGASAAWATRIEVARCRAACAVGLQGASGGRLPSLNGSMQRLRPKRLVSKARLPRLLASSRLPKKRSLAPSWRTHMPRSFIAFGALQHQD